MKNKNFFLQSRCQKKRNDKFGRNSSNFERNTLIIDWIKKLDRSEDIYCANDNIFSPIHVNDLCLIIENLVTNMEKGIFHACSIEALNRKKMLEYLIYKFRKKKQYNGGGILETHLRCVK